MNAGARAVEAVAELERDLAVALALLSVLYPATRDDEFCNRFTIYLGLPTGKVGWNLPKEDLGLFHELEYETEGVEAYTSYRRDAVVLSLVKQIIDARPRTVCPRVLRGPDGTVVLNCVLDSHRSGNHKDTYGRDWYVSAPDHGEEEPTP